MLVAFRFGQNILRVPHDTLESLMRSGDMEIMLRAAAHVMSQEAPVLQLQQPCHVFGDIHGNFSDLKVSGMRACESTACN